MKIRVAMLLALSLGLAACDRRSEPPRGMPSGPISNALAAEPVKDPVCGMNVDPGKSLTEEYKGKKYYFCAEDCRRKFAESPEKYVSRPLR